MNRKEKRSVGFDVDGTAEQLAQLMMEDVASRCDTFFDALKETHPTLSDSDTALIFFKAQMVFGVASLSNSLEKVSAKTRIQNLAKLVRKICPQEELRAFDEALHPLLKLTPAGVVEF